MPDSSTDPDKNSNPANSDQSPRTFETEEGEVPFNDLPREEQLGVMFNNIDEVVQRLRTEWEEDRLQVYFLFYSFAMVGVMFYLIYQTLTWALIGTFGIYFGTIIPALYLYEEEEVLGSGGISGSLED